MKAINPKKLKVGDIIEQWVHFDHSPQEMKMTGEVIWIHPENRFYRVRFKTTKGTYFTESYRFYGKHHGDAYVPEESNKYRHSRPAIVEGSLL